MKQVQPVELTVSSLINHLHSGLSWLKKDDIGYGSIQEKYDATESQILTIQKHPKLVNIEPVRVFFNLIDDTEPENSPAEEQVSAGTATEVREQLVDVGPGTYDMEAPPQPALELHRL